MGKQKLWRTSCFVDEKSGVVFSGEQINFGEAFFFWRSPEFGRKNRFKKGKHLFFWKSLNFDKKSSSIWFKTDENLGQVCLLLFPASKKAPTFAKFWLRACAGIYIKSAWSRRCFWFSINACVLSNVFVLNKWNSKIEHSKSVRSTCGCIMTSYWSDKNVYFDDSNKVINPKFYQCLYYI